MPLLRMLFELLNMLKSLYIYFILFYVLFHFLDVFFWDLNSAPCISKHVNYIANLVNVKTNC